MSTVTFPNVEPGAAPYQLRGAAVQLMKSRHPETVISGSAGTGKSRSCGELLFRAAIAYPGCRLLIVRKTRASLTETFLVTWERHVIPSELSSITEGASRATRQAYHFPNDSEIVISGMDYYSKVMSSEYDLIYVQEATEITEEEWEALSTRLRNNVMPYQRIIGDCNPDAPSHWIKKRAARGQLELLESVHEDNPVLYDAKTQTWTPAGLQYIARLDSLTGVLHDRLRKGIWAQAEGAVYPGFARRVHLIDPFVPPDSWPRYGAVDFGFVHPFAFAWGAEDEDGRLYVYRTYSHSRRLVSEHSALLKQLSVGDPPFQAVAADHDAEGRADLQRNTGWATVPARKQVRDGIQAVADRLVVQPDGRPRLFVMRDCHHGEGMPLPDELESYTWKKQPAGVPARPGDEEPVKLNDDLADCARYLVMHLDGGGHGGWTPSSDDFAIKPADFNLEEHLRGSGSARLFGGH